VQKTKSGAPQITFKKLTSIKSSILKFSTPVFLITYSKKGEFLTFGGVLAAMWVRHCGR
jgi:hypothetical protein